MKIKLSVVLLSILKILNLGIIEAQSGEGTGPPKLEGEGDLESILGLRHERVAGSPHWGTRPSRGCPR